MLARVLEQTAEKWQQLMTCQTDLLLPAELPFYVRAESWSRAGTVLDIGTGNGYYLRRLATYFPEKSYTGIDISAAHIHAAVDSTATDKGLNKPQIQFVESDFFDYAGEFDIAIARLCIQHIRSLDRFLEHMRKVVRPGGSVIVVESCDEDRMFIPDMDGIGNFFDALRDNRKSSGYDRDAGKILDHYAEKARFSRVQQARVTTSSDPPGFKQLFFETYMTVLDLVENDFRVESDYSALKNELALWLDNSGAYTHLSVDMSCYEVR